GRQCHGQMCARSAREVPRQGCHMAQQGVGGDLLAGGLLGTGVPGTDPQAACAADCTPVVGPQLEAFTAETAAVVVGLVDEMAQFELGAALGGRELQSQLAVGVVEDQAVVALAAEPAALEPRERSCVAVPVRVRAHAVPGRGIAAHQVALGTGPMIAGLGKQAVGCSGRLFPPGCRGSAALALPVVEAADDDRPVDVTFQEADQHLLSDARQELAADPGAGVTLRDAEPAAVLTRRGAALEVEADPDASQGIRVELTAAF